MTNLVFSLSDIGLWIVCVRGIYDGRLYKLNDVSVKEKGRDSLWDKYRFKKCSKLRGNSVFSVIFYKQHS